MELGQIKIFLKAAENGSLTKAAGELYVSHSTVSRAIADLESELERELLVRGNRGVALTKQGELLQREGEKLLARVDELKQMIRGVTD